MNKNSIPVLIIAYCRLNSLKLIISELLRNNTSDIYIVCDLANEQSPNYLQNLEVRKYLNELMSTPNCRYTILIRERKYGCSLNVLLGVNWFFSHVSFGIILEDDCVPSSHFLRFVNISKSELQNNPDIWFICGTQVVPKFLIPDSWVLSNYPQFWGWATESKKWDEIKRELLHFRYLNTDDKHLSYLERVYWNAGSRRAINSFTDVWDTVIVQLMRKHKKLSLLPARNTITNIGNDSWATNVKVSNLDNYSKVYSFENPETHAELNFAADEWIAREIFKINFVRIFSIPVNRFLDLFKSKIYQENLIRRLESYDFFRIDS